MQPTELLAIIAAAKKETAKAVKDALPTIADMVRKEVDAKEVKTIADVAVTLKGDKGDKGDTGEIGPQGETGPKGDTGEIGPQGVQGPKGDAGINGVDGRDGRDGKDGSAGRNGANGKDGVGVAEVAIGDDGHLYVALDNGRVIDAGVARGRDGKDGKSGKDGKAGAIVYGGGGGSSGGGGLSSPIIPEFIDVIDAKQSSLIESNSVTISGDENTIWPAVVRGEGSPEIQINSGSWGNSGIFRIGDILKIRATSAPSANVSRSVTLYAQGVSLPWVITTSKAFNPSTLFASGEQGWFYDNSDFSTMFQDAAGTIPVTAVGQPVGRQLDKSGRGNHRTQSTALNRPTLQQDGAGLYYLSYDGINDSMATASFAWGTDKATICAGVRKLSDAASGMVVETSVSIGGNPGSMYLAAPESTTLRYSSASRGNVGVSITIVATIAASGAAPDTAVITAAHNIAGDLSTIRRNGVAGNSATGDKGSGNFGTYPVFFGARAGTSVFFNGREYSQFAINRLLTTQELADIETYTNGKTGAY